MKRFEKYYGWIIAFVFCVAVIAVYKTFDNFNNRCVHHHVFNTPLLVKIANHLNFKICDIQHFNPFNIIILLQKNEESLADNNTFLNHKNEVYQKEKFPSDKIW